MRHISRINKRITNTNRNTPSLQFTIYGKTTTTVLEKLNVFVNNLEGIFATNSDAHRTFRVRSEQAVNDLLRQQLAERAKAAIHSGIT
jgi:hypothetical protein